MCHEQKISCSQQPAATQPSSRNLQAVLSQDGGHAACDEPLPAPRKFIRQAVVKRSVSSPHATTDSNKDFKHIATCKAALGRSIASEEPALWAEFCGC